MKKYFIFLISLTLIIMMSCSVPNTSITPKSLTAAILGTSTGAKDAKEGEKNNKADESQNNKADESQNNKADESQNNKADESQNNKADESQNNKEVNNGNVDNNTTDNQNVSKSKEEVLPKVEKAVQPSVVTSTKLPLAAADLAGKDYFGYVVLPESIFDEDDDDEAFADRRLTLRFNLSAQSNSLKADFGDADTEVESKKAKTKTNLDVAISGMFITLLDNGNTFLKLEVSKDFQFMFITEDKITSKPIPSVDYTGVGLALNGQEYHANLPGHYNGPILPKLPQYPFGS